MPVARPLLPMPLLACVAALGVTTPVLAQTVRKVTRLADGVYAIEHQDAGDGYASGNTTVIIGDRQAFVVDAGFLPSTAREDIAQIRRWTDKPVAFLLPCCPTAASPRPTRAPHVFDDREGSG